VFAPASERTRKMPSRISGAGLRRRLFLWGVIPLALLAAFVVIERCPNRSPALAPRSRNPPKTSTSMNCARQTMTSTSQRLASPAVGYTTWMTPTRVCARAARASRASAVSSGAPSSVIASASATYVASYAEKLCLSVHVRRASTSCG
jgi:hypothetical protein